MNPIELGKFIANLRVEKKLTQEDLAEKLYVDKRKISRWECGTSIPDFDMLIKLSEILNVSLYELSICKRLDKEKLSTKAINKLKGIKDFKKYKLKKKLKIIFLIILSIFFIFTAIYTIKFYGTVEIYDMESLDEKYVLKGNYIRANNFTIYNISELTNNNTSQNIIQNIDNCKFEIYNNKFRVKLITKSNKNNKGDEYKNSFIVNNNVEFLNNEFINKVFHLKLICNDDSNNSINYTIKFQFIKKYDNKLF